MIINSPLGLLSPYFTVRQQTHLATMSLNHLAQCYLVGLSTADIDALPRGQKCPPCAKRLLSRLFKGLRATAP